MAMSEHHGRMIPDSPEREWIGVGSGDYTMPNPTQQELAYLNAIPSQVAIINLDGEIVMVNTAWEQFGQHNGLPPGYRSVGSNYLAVCRDAVGTEEEGAYAAAVGIRQVLGGLLPLFTMEYPCHSPDVQRWFRMQVTAVPNEDGQGIGGAMVMHMDISARKLAEIELQHREEQYRSLFEVHPQPMWIFDLKSLRILAVNYAAMHVYGYSREEFLEMTIADLRPNDEVSRLVAYIQNEPESHHSAGIWKHRHKDGSIHEVEAFSYPVVFQGEAARLVQCVDVTAAVWARKQLEDSVALMEHAQAIGKMGSWRYDFETGKLVWSPEVYRLVGLSPHEFTGDYGQYRAMIAEEDLPVFVQAIKRADAGLGPIDVEYRLCRPDGEQVWLYTRGSVDFDSKGNPVRRLGITMDITERKLAESALIASEKRYKAIAENSSDLVFVNRNDRIEYVNPAGVALLRARSADDLIGLSPFDIFHPDSHDVVRKRIQQLQAGPCSVPLIQEQLLARDGSVVDVETVATSYFDQGSLHIQVTCRDITERLRMEREVEEHLRREREARRVADEASYYYRSLFESAPGNYLVLTPDEFRVVAVSESFLNATMTTREQIVGSTLFDAFPDDPGDPEADGVRNLLQSLERVKRFQMADVMPVQRYPIRRSEEMGGGFEERFWSSLNSPVLGPTGEVVYIIHRVEDVTDFVREKESQGEGKEAWRVLESRAQQMEADIILRAKDLQRLNHQLQSREAFIAMACAMARMGAWSVDLIIGMVAWSKEVYDIHETPHDYVPNVEDGISFYAPEFQDVIRSHFEACARDGVPYDLELQIITARGRRVWVRSIGTPVYDVHGSIVQVQGAFQDITEKKQRDEELMRKDALLRMAGSVARIGAWVFDVELDAAQLSPEAAQMLGIDPEHGSDIRHFRERISREKQTALDEAITDCALHGNPFDLQVNTADGRGELLTIRVMGEPVRDANGKVHLVRGAIQDVTELEAARLREQEATRQLSATLENLQEGFITLDREYRISYANEAAATLLHTSPDLLKGKLISELFPETEDGGFRGKLHWAMERNERAEFEVVYDPLGKWFGFRVFPAPDGLAVYLSDVSEKRQAVEHLRLNEERFRLLSQASADLVWDWDIQAGTVWRSSNLTSVFGSLAHQEAGSADDWAMRIHPDDRHRVSNELRTALDAGEDSCESEYRFLVEQGRYVEVADCGQVVRDANGVAVRMVGGMRDITARKLYEHQLLEQAALIDESSDAIIVADLENRIVFWSKGASATYGWTAAEAFGKMLPTLVCRDPVDFDAGLANLREDGTWSGELHHVTQSGAEITVLARLILMRDANGQANSILLISTDITERKRLESQLLRAQRLESLGVLAGGIAHDFNNVLAPILMSIELLRLDVSRDDKLTILDKLQYSAEHGSSLIRQILSFARGLDEQRSLFSPLSVAQEVESTIRDTFPRSIHIELTAGHELKLVNGNASQIYQVLMNLCVNARDAMPLGGTLSLRLENIVVDDVIAGMHLDATPGEYVAIQVSDDGQGMDHSTIDRIFEPFFTTKEVGKGTGLGLPTAYSIVRGHGGFITIYSELGRGSTFKVYLPVAAAGTSDESSEMSLGDLPLGCGEMVLIVDDEPSLRDVAQATLLKFGYGVLTARHGADALPLYVTHRNEIAVVITDISMPVMDGPALIAAIHSIDPDLPIIASSGLGLDAQLAEAQDAGVKYFLPKPYSADRMLRLLRQVLDAKGDSEAESEAPPVPEVAERPKTEAPQEPTIYPKVSLARILIVDDMEPLRSLIEQILANAGYDPIVSASGTEALKRFDETSPQPTVVITDVGMPGMSGFQLVDALRQRNPGIKVVLMTGDDQTVTGWKGFSADTACVLAKPFSPAALLALLKDMLEE